MAEGTAGFRNAGCRIQERGSRIEQTVPAVRRSILDPESSILRPPLRNGADGEPTRFAGWRKYPPPRSSRSIPKRPSLDPLRRSWSAFRCRSSPETPPIIPLAHNYAGAPAQLGIDARAGEAQAVARGRARGQSSARTSSTTRTCSPITACVSTASSHDTLLQSYVLESHQPHDMDNLAFRHLGVKTITLRRGHRQGRQPDRLRPGGSRTRHRLRGGRRRHHAAAASRAVSADRERTRSSRKSTVTSKCR